MTYKMDNGGNLMYTGHPDTPLIQTFQLLTNVSDTIISKLTLLSLNFRGMRTSTGHYIFVQTAGPAWHQYAIEVAGSHGDGAWDVVLGKIADDLATRASNPGRAEDPTLFPHWNPWAREFNVSPRINLRTVVPLDPASPHRQEVY